MTSCSVVVREEGLDLRAKVAVGREAACVEVEGLEGVAGTGLRCWMALLVVEWGGNGLLLPHAKARSLQPQCIVSKSTHLHNLNS